MDLLGSERDMDPPRAAAAPARAYAVCSTWRSGSGLLCRGLASTGAAATPIEYFNDVGRRILCDRWGCGSALGEYMHALYARRTGRDGVFGTKLHWDQMVKLRAEALGLPPTEPRYDVPAEFLERLFPGLTYVRILRRDVDRQAISLWAALTSDKWSLAPDDHAAGPEHDRVPYSYDGIDRCRRLIENSEVHWDRFMRFNGIEPLVVVYEELAAAYVPTLQRVLREVAPAADTAVPPAPSTRRLSDERTERFLERYIADRQVRGLPLPLDVDTSEPAGVG